MLLGSFMLTSGNPPEFRINWWTIIPTVVFVALFFVFVVAKALLIQTKKPATGAEGLVGEVGEVSVAVAPGKPGKVFVHGEIWNAKSNFELPEGAPCRVERVEGMTLWVVPAEEE